MKFIVFGLPGSGKSSLIAELATVFDWEIIKIDDFRQQFGDGSTEKEELARAMFLESVKAGTPQIIECTGAGSVAKLLVQKIKHLPEKVICLTVIVSKELSIQRVKDRRTVIPFPSGAGGIDSFIERTASSLRPSEIARLWSDRDNTFLFFKRNNNATDFAELTFDAKTLMSSGLIHASSDVIAMCEPHITNYYGESYFEHQRGVVKSNSKMEEDKCNIDMFLKDLEIKGSLLDVGAGDCQWFEQLSDHLERYIAVDMSGDAIARGPSDSKLVKIVGNIFDHSVIQACKSKWLPTSLFFSFFLSHFTDEAIIRLVREFLPEQIIIIDSFWGETQQKKYGQKGLQLIRRKAHPAEFIKLPKRFFDKSDIAKIGVILDYSINKFESWDYWFGAFLTKNKN